MIKKVLYIASVLLVLSQAAFANGVSSSVSQTIRLVIPQSIRVSFNTAYFNSKMETVKNTTPAKKSTFSVNSNDKFIIFANTTEANITPVTTASGYGQEQVYAVNYKSRKSADVVYTATQP